MTKLSLTAVAICTRNRADHLRNALMSVQRAHPPFAQVIVADDSDDDRTALLISEEFPDVIYVRGRQRGLGPNRNLALSRVTSDWVLFLDDDATVGSAFPAAMRERTSKLGEGARVILSGLVDEYGVLAGPAEQDFLGFQRYQAPHDANPRNVAILATLFPAQMFDEVLFDERLVHGCDEIDLVVRAVAKGWTVVICPDAINHHWRVASGRDYYLGHHDTARIYTTMKRHLLIDRRYDRAAAFALAAPAHAVFAGLKRHGPSGGLTAARASWRAYRHLSASVREQR